MAEKLHASPQRNASSSLEQLLLGADMVNPTALNEACQSAKRLDVPLDKALIMLKSASEINLRTAVQANEMVKKGKVSLELAIKALRLAKQNGIQFEDALNVMGSVVNKTQQMSAAGNPLVELLLASKLLSTSQIAQVIQQSKDAEMSIGRTLIVNRLLSRWALQEALIAQSLIKDEKVARHQAEQALRLAMQRHVSVLQVLFEAGVYNECSGETIKLSELVVLAGLLTDSDYLDCLEISLCQDKPFGQVMLEGNLITLPVLDAACSILDMVGSYLKPFQAADALRQVRITGVLVYQAIAELQPPPQIPQRSLSLADLLIEARVQSKEAVLAAVGDGQEAAIKTGKRLMAAGMISETCLYKALRCHSLLKEGILSTEQALTLMASCKDDATSIEEALAKAGWNVPARMHWSWV